MTPTTYLSPAVRMPRSALALKAASIFWFITVVIGQSLFVAYILSLYGGPTVTGHFEGWSRNTGLFNGYVAGDFTGNAMFGAHMMGAALITLGGTLQLIPQIRTHARTFHRWNGRVYMVTACVMALGGLYLVWVRGGYFHIPGALAISLNAVLILAFAFLTLKHAIARNIAVHQRWALRLFIVVSGVWFIRVGLMGWIIINQGPVGMTSNMDGWFDYFWVVGSYLLPLAILELYLRARATGSALHKYAVAGLVTLATLVMAVGIFGAYMFMWKAYLWP
ncbi:DUF2306 domain-containing protein [Hyphomonas johnsonii]|uniref:DUF2306 domain-containing protein n=1 Tax=Hyphomonas johnsonii MHS-2 TaxID=1280950 RepID=A0A059FTD0_9PROT|nr:DUF2306 domain-containing protein [Hyphomonas johnsonii]KCZ93761.1 hypothetical protein HJO_00255 [Hyphomonas johnsonii MHS-2]